MASGLPAVRATCEQIGLGFDPWQVGGSQAVLAKDAAGMYAADTVVVSIPRQVGKTYWIGALVFADCIINPGTTTVWTAHRFKVARETFNALKATALSPPMAAHVDPEDIYTAAGNESINFRNGSRIVFAARERGAIRGFSKVRRLILDEAQILTEAAMADLAPTMNQAVNPQMILMGTPPKPSDPGETFTNLRREALSGNSEALVYLEFAAPEGADLDDREAWRVANPSYPGRTPEKAIVRLRKLLADDGDFAREALGMWTTEKPDKDKLIPSGSWDPLADATSEPLDPVAFSLDVDPLQMNAAIAVAGRRDDGRTHVECTDHRPGTGWVVARMVELANKWGPCAIAVGKGPAASLIPALEEAGLDIVRLTSEDYSWGCNAFYDEVMQGTLRHPGEDSPGAGDDLSDAVANAKRRPVGDGWGFDRRDSAIDITPLVAVSNARYAFTIHGPAVTEDGDGLIF